MTNDDVGTYEITRSKGNLVETLNIHLCYFVGNDYPDLVTNLQSDYYIDTECMVKKDPTIGSCQTDTSLSGYPVY